MRGRFQVLAAMLAAALVCAAPAAADPAGPTNDAPTTTEAAPPPPPPAASGIGTALAQSGAQPTGPLGLPDLSAYTSNLILGQNPVPTAPGATVQATAPNLSAFNSDYLLPQNLTPAPPGQGTPAPGIGANEDVPGAGRIAFLRRLYAMYQGGALQGALLGQNPAELPADAAPSPTG